MTEPNPTVADWQPIATCPDDEWVMVTDGVMSYSSCYPLGDEETHWAPLPAPPAPDPMTVLAWHPMATLPDKHDDRVLIRYPGDTEPIVHRQSRRVADDSAHRLGWLPLAPLLALIPEAEQ